ncbi:hypothetical protein BH24GEM3_BH24GEM3_08330 [soil metagenome]|nr:hypothetical protein [Gemmatimonadota bacterium]
MKYRLTFTTEAREVLRSLESTDRPKHKKVLKTLALLETNPRHPSLQTHKYRSLSGPSGEDVFEAYVEQHTPGAWRVFWYYKPERGMIRILNITPHP